MELIHGTTAVYMMTNHRHGTIYTGVTGHLLRRIVQHRDGSVEGFTKRYGLKRLVWFEMHDGIVAAIQREKSIKKYPRDWKINLITEAIKVSFFLGYLWLIGQFKEIKRIFMYHGAEHQAINTMEAEQELTIDNCLKQTRLHPRCGTSFAIIVLIVSIVLFTFVPRPHGYSPVVIGLIRFLVEIPLLFVVAGVSYELLRIAGRFRNTTFVKFAFWPGLMSQYLTTRMPDAAQTEVALVALKEVLAAEERGGPPPVREDALESAPPIPIP